MQRYICIDVSVPARVHAQSTATDPHITTLWAVRALYIRSDPLDSSGWLYSFQNEKQTVRCMVHSTLALVSRGPIVGNSTVAFIMQEVSVALHDKKIN